MHPDDSIPVETLDAPVPVELAELRLDDGRVLLSVAGEVDLGSAPTLKLALGKLQAQEGLRAIILDLSRLKFLDSTGLAVLIGYRRRLDEGQRLVVVDPPDHVLRLFAITGIGSAFETFTTLEDALHYLDETGNCDSELPLSPDAALVFGLASTAVPFASTRDAEALCWSRILLPVGDPAVSAERPLQQEGADRLGAEQRLTRVLTDAARFARQRGAIAIRRGDLVRAVSLVYGIAFDRAVDAYQATDTF